MDMEALMAQAAELQNKVTAAQEKLETIHIKGIAAGGACVVDMTGKYDVTDVIIREDVLAGGASAVAKIVADAYRDAKSKADDIINDVMGAATAGIPMPE